MQQSGDSFDDIWELAEFCAREAFLLRSFLEYLRMWPDPLEKKWARLQKWHQEIGLQHGNTHIADYASQLFQRLRAEPPEVRKEILQKAFEAMSSSYFQSSS